MAKLYILQALTAFKDFAWKKKSKKKQNLRFSSNFRLNLRHVFNLYFAQNIFFWLLQVQENIFHTLIIFLATLELAPRALQKSKFWGENIFSNFFFQAKSLNVVSACKMQNVAMGPKNSKSLNILEHFSYPGHLRSSKTKKNRGEWQGGNKILGFTVLCCPIQ